MLPDGLFFPAGHETTGMVQMCADVPMEQELVDPTNFPTNFPIVMNNNNHWYKTRLRAPCKARKKSRKEKNNNDK